MHMRQPVGRPRSASSNPASERRRLRRHVNQTAVRNEGRDRKYGTENIGDDEASLFVICKFGLVKYRADKKLWLN